MEQTLIAGLLLSLLGGLGWLGCHHSRFAIKVTIVLLALTTLLHLGIKVCNQSWHNIYSFDKTTDGVFYILEAAFTAILLFSITFQKHNKKSENK